MSETYKPKTIAMMSTVEALLIINNDEVFYNACGNGSLATVINRLRFLFNQRTNMPEWFDFGKADAKRLEQRIKEIQKEVRS